MTISEQDISCDTLREETVILPAQACSEMVILF